MRILAPFSAKRVPERSLYRVREGRGLSPIGRLAMAAAMLAVGCAMGGCSMGIFGKEAKKDDLSDVTGSIGPIIRSHDDTNLTDADLALARNAASDVLTSGQKDISQPWENPETGARGSVTPLASTYTNEGRTCRDFLASYVRGANEGWLQGAACREGKGEAWEIRSMKPWKRS